MIRNIINYKTDIDTIIFPVGGQGKRIASFFKSINYKGSKVTFIVKGKPLLCHSIDSALELGFKRIFLLTDYHEDNILQLINKYYYGNKKIQIVRGSKKGVPHALFSLTSKLTRPFIVSDGNILYNKSFLLKMMPINTFSNNILVNLAVSYKDEAKTHLQLLIKKNHVSYIGARVEKSKFKYNGQISSYYCSLGLMSISPKLFKLLPNIKVKKDFDLVLEELFALGLKNGCSYINTQKYKGNWLAIHDKLDIDSIINKC